MRTLVFSLLVFVLLTPDLPADQRPNILVILADDLGYNDVGFQGCKEIPTPNLDHLAKTGVRCTQAYVSHPVCSPSRAGLLTGRHQARFGHERNPSHAKAGEGLPAIERLLPEFLVPAGYATGWIGKWHLGGNLRETVAKKFLPENRGFQETFGFLGGHRHYFPSKYPPYSDGALERNGRPVADKEYVTTAFGNEAVAFIKRHQKQPWFLYLAFNAPHSPLQAPIERIARFDHIPNKMRRTYAAMVSIMDDSVGDVMKALTDTDQMSGTLVFFLSDNGAQTTDASDPSEHSPSIWQGGSNGSLRHGKGHPYEGGIRVPFVASWPGHLPAETTYDHPVSALDIFATALACASVPMPEDKRYDSVNLIPYLTKEKKERPHEMLFWRRNESAWAAVRVGDMKIVRHDALPANDRKRPARGAFPDELFNIPADLGERHNLAAADPATTENLNGILDAWFVTMARHLAFTGNKVDGPELTWAKANPPVPSDKPVLFVPGEHPGTN